MNKIQYEANRIIAEITKEYDNKILEDKGNEKMNRKKPENTEELFLLTYEMSEKIGEIVDDLEKWKENIEKRLRDIELMRKN